jgi:hypothetical protein
VHFWKVTCGKVIDSKESSSAVIRGEKNSSYHFNSTPHRNGSVSECWPKPDFPHENVGFVGLLKKNLGTLKSLWYDSVSGPELD